MFQKYVFLPFYFYILPYTAVSYNVVIMQLYFTFFSNSHHIFLTFSGYIITCTEQRVIANKTFSFSYFCRESMRFPASFFYSVIFIPLFFIPLDFLFNMVIDVQSFCLSVFGNDRSVNLLFSVFVFCVFSTVVET